MRKVDDLAIIASTEGLAFCNIELLVDEIA